MRLDEHDHIHQKTEYPFLPFSDVFIHAKTHNDQFISSGEIADQAILKFDWLHIFCA